MLPRLVRFNAARASVRTANVSHVWYSTSGEATAGLTEGEKHIYTKLFDSLAPHRLQVTDVSGGCGSMYAVEIASQQFEGKSIVKQHRLVNEILKEEIKGMHGLQLRTTAK